jgi:hypothetical protein
MRGFGPLFLLYLLTHWNGGGSAPAYSFPTPKPNKPPKPHPHKPRPDPAYSYPPAPKPPAPVPAASKPSPSPLVYSSAPVAPWVAYKPLNPAVIKRAQQLLTDVTVHELIEQDPAHAGRKVRYLRTTDNPPGHTSVTAWMPRGDSPHLLPA